MMRVSNTFNAFQNKGMQHTDCKGVQKSPQNDDSISFPGDVGNIDF
jgi:hypothetical protein